MKMTCLRDITDVTRRADLDHRRFLDAIFERMIAHRKKIPNHVDPAEAETFPVHRVFGITHRQPLQIFSVRQRTINKKIVNRESSLFRHRAHFGEARILIPPAALIEIGERDKGRREKK